jgi:hypothetical protein
MAPLPTEKTGGGWDANTTINLIALVLAVPGAITGLVALLVLRNGHYPRFRGLYVPTLWGRRSPEFGGGWVAGVLSEEFFTDGTALPNGFRQRRLRCLLINTDKRASASHTRAQGTFRALLTSRTERLYSFYASLFTRRRRTTRTILPDETHARLIDRFQQRYRELDGEISVERQQWVEEMELSSREA